MTDRHLPAEYFCRSSAIDLPLPQKPSPRFLIFSLQKLGPTHACITLHLCHPVSCKLSAHLLILPHHSPAGLPDLLLVPDRLCLPGGFPLGLVR
jgi:hypothetical protein